MPAENNVVVVFVKNNARILHNPPDLKVWTLDKLAAVNPDMSLVKGLPPHLWDLENGKVVPLHESKVGARQEAALLGDVETSCVRKKECSLAEAPSLPSPIVASDPYDAAHTWGLSLLVGFAVVLVVAIWRSLHG